MASSSSDGELPFPLSSCKAASKPKDRKRYRETYSSSTSSGSSPKKARTFFHEPENKKVKKFESTDILCLYPKDSYLGTYPSFIRYVKQHPSPAVDTIVETSTGNLEAPMENTKLDLCHFDLPTLSETEKKMEDFIFNCAEIFLGSLQGDVFYRWRDTGSLSRIERRERCRDMAEKYGINEGHAENVEIGFTFLHDAFLYGFSNGSGRSAIGNLFKICSHIPRKNEKDFIVNLGGGSPQNEGNTTTLQVYSTSSGKPTRKEAEKQLSLQMAEVKVWVPDTVVYTYKNTPDEREEFRDEKIYYMFAKCKSGHATKKTLYYQLWHESLCGLINSDVVYSCGICSSFMTLCKLYLDGNVLKTRIISMWFGKLQGDDDLFYFDIVEFKKFIQYITKAIQDQET